MVTTRRKRGLTDEERELWQKVAESVEPLVRLRWRRAAKRKAEAAAAEPGAEGEPAPATPQEPPMTMAELLAPPPPEPPSSPAHRPHPQHVKPPHKAGPTPLSPIDARTKRKIAKGAVPLEERIDLHGMTQADAYPALRGFIAGARARGVKMVLVITGKGQRAPRDHAGHDVFSPGERGVLRRLVPQWLSLPDMREYVVGFEEAHVAHGGSGAIYVRLRAIRKAHGKPAKGTPL